MKKPVKIVLVVALLLALAVTAGPFIYINFLKSDAPAALTLDNSTNTTLPDSSNESEPINIEGNWTITTETESVVGYRVKEILFGQSTEGVGRTNEIAGALTIANNSVTAATFTVQMGTLTSDAANRDRQFNNRIMDTNNFPTATFTLSSPLALPNNAIDGAVVTVDATGDLTLRGVTQPVTFPLQAQLSGQTFTVVGNITIVFDQWNIPEPSVPGISVDPEGLLEFSLVFSR